MDKESMLQIAEDEWLGAITSNKYWQTKYPDSEVVSPEEANWHWFWLILAESIWPSSIVEDATDDFRKWLITGE